MHYKSKEEVLKELSVDPRYGVGTDEIASRRARFGANVMESAKKKSLCLRVLVAFSEPMLLILCFALAITFGVNVGKYARTGDGDFTECVGIFIALVTSVTITVVMEGRSEKAFELLSAVSDRTVVKVRRGGEVTLVPQSEIVAGDVLILESGCKVAADGRVILSENLSADESALTGESKPRAKRADAVIRKDAPLAERINCVYGGTVITSGSGETVVTAVGNNAEIGKIAQELKIKNKVSSPLDEKLSRLGKAVTIIGGVSAAVVFIVSLIRLILAGNASFASVQEIFIESVVLIVAAVPEGLPTIVAISLSLNVLKLAKENALIKKLVVAETAGCVSVICSDKTGTLTQNKMVVEDFFGRDGKRTDKIPKVVRDNIIYNSTADAAREKGKLVWAGNPTERALLGKIFASPTEKLAAIRAAAEVAEREEFTSDRKYSSAKTRINGTFCTFYKGAFEKIAALCKEDGALSAARRETENCAENARRVIAFAHSEGENVVYDGFAAITDPVRPDVKTSVELCGKAGIAVKILTGDNAATAFAVARELGIAKTRAEVINAADAERMNDAALTSALKRVSVIARSTPLMKLRVVNLLKKAGEVVAVTGDGINDAPAIKQADIGIAMGSGSEIAKEAGDIVLLDDSFTTIVKAISFGRNVYCNFQRFIMFQLSVNFSAVMTVLACLFSGVKSPFNALQLLWLNIIMDGPPALTLGFEAPQKELMNDKPKRRSGNLVTKKTAARILAHSVYMAGIITAQTLFNFMRVPAAENATVVFTTFVFFQLFNAFNSRQVGYKSIFMGFFSNRLMLLAFGAVTALQVVITQFGGAAFGTAPLSPLSWAKVIAVSSTILFISEASKAAYRVYLRVSGKIAPPKLSALSAKR